MYNKAINYILLSINSDSKQVYRNRKFQLRAIEMHRVFNMVFSASIVFAASLIINLKQYYVLTCVYFKLLISHFLAFYKPR